MEREPLATTNRNENFQRNIDEKFHPIAVLGVGVFRRIPAHIKLKIGFVNLYVIRVNIVGELFASHSNVDRWLEEERDFSYILDFIDSSLDELGDSLTVFNLANHTETNTESE
uniref:Uncharacterized protein n=1 Tax=Pristionchus pacificus TaxID=54126 RepID=A0A2A6CS04_PRIPA|eukprot:PDM80992.1 hypothetical protein PRIPAC_35995 [Pristionchus pacificus]